jgi:hypothetical protein
MEIDCPSTPPVTRGFNVHGVHFHIIGSTSAAMLRFPGIGLCPMIPV